MATTYSTYADQKLIDRPRTITNPGEEGGPLIRRRVKRDLTTGDDAADVIVLIDVPTNCILDQVLLTTDGNATAGATDLGFYTADTFGTMTVVDADAVASAQVVTSALTKSNVVNESGVITAAELDTPLWSAIGAASDPGGVYWLCATITTDIDAATTFRIDVEYFIGN